MSRNGKSNNSTQSGFRVDPDDPWRDIPVGLCEKMAYTLEMQERERQNRLSRYEVQKGVYPPKADFNLVVKEFIRSCVGNETQRPEQLRPAHVLEKTTHHLLTKICPTDDHWLDICDFVYNRLCSVRQDMVIQRIQGSTSILLLESSCRFLIYSCYRLNNTILKHSDYKGRNGSRKEYASFAQRELNIMNELKLNDKCLKDCLRSLIGHYNDDQCSSDNRATFECLNLIRNISFHGGFACEVDYFAIPEDLRDRNEKIQKVYKIIQEYSVNNHTRAFRLLSELSEEPILVLAFAPLISQIQVRLVKMLRKAARRQTCSVADLAKIICPECLEKDQKTRHEFTRYIAGQFKLYKYRGDLIEFNQPMRDPFEKPEEINPLSEQIHFSCNWSLFKDAVEKQGMKNLLWPYADKDFT